MKKRMISLLLASGISLALAGCGSKKNEAAPTASPKLTAEQLNAKFSYDLGPATVDISGYPKEIQEDYQKFLTVCAGCHTAARPLNAPYATEEEWKRFVQRMHYRMENRGFDISGAEAKQVIRFLAYDSNERKVKNKAAFETQQKSLENLFEEVKKNRAAETMDSTNNLPKKEADYTGVK